MRSWLKGRSPAESKISMVQESSNITVATYNVHQCVGTDGRRDPGRIARVILELNASVLGLQEVDSESGGTEEKAQMNYLSKATGYKAIPGPTIKRHRGHYGNVLLTAFPVRESRDVDLSFRTQEPRGAIVAVLDVCSRPLRVIVTHLGLNSRERSHQVEILKEIIRAERADPLILLGDMNEWFPLAPALRTLNRHMGKPPGPPSFPSRFPVLALDRIWVDPIRALGRVRVHRTPLACIASDHLPVTAGIEIPPPRSDGV